MAADPGRNETDTSSNTKVLELHLHCASGPGIPGDYITAQRRKPRQGEWQLKSFPCHQVYKEPHSRTFLLLHASVTTTCKFSQHPTVEAHIPAGQTAVSDKQWNLSSPHQDKSNENCQIRFTKHLIYNS